MDSEPKLGRLIIKSPDQLKQQTRAINVQQGLGYGNKNLELPESFLTDPTVFKRHLEMHRARPYDELPRLARGKFTQDKLERYEQYLTALRELRKSQAETIKSFKETHPDPPPENAYQAADRFNPKLATQVLQKINSSIWQDEKRPFTPKAIQNATTSEETFMGALDKALSKKPDIIYRGFDYLQYVFTPEKIKEIVLKGGPHYGFLEHYKDLKSLFSPEEQKALITPVMYEGRYGNLIVEMFKDPHAAGLFSRDEVKKAVMIGLEDNVMPMFMSKQIAFYTGKVILTSQDVETVMVERVRGFKDLDHLEDVVPLLPSSESLDKIKTEIVDTYTNRGTVSDLTKLPFVAGFLTPDQKLQIVRETVLRDKFKSGFYISTCEDLITPELFAPILREVMYSPEIPLTGHGVGDILYAKSLTLEDKERYIDYLISSGQGSLLLEKINTNLYQFKEEAKRDELARKIFSTCQSYEIAKKYSAQDTWAHAVSADLVKDFISSADFKSIDQWLFRLELWGNRIKNKDPEFVVNFLEKYKDTHGTSMLYRLNPVLYYLPDERKTTFVTDLIYANPVNALATLQQDPKTFTIVDIDMSASKILEIAVSDTTRLSFAPKTLREFYKLYDPQKPAEEQKALLIEAFGIYRAISYIKAQGLEADFRRIQSSKDLSSTGERDLLSTFYCFTLLKNTNPEQFAQLDTLGNTVEESKQILFNQFSRILNLDRQLTSEHIGRFFGTMESPVPFMMYLLQHKDSLKHKKLLTDIFTAITDGKFTEWKYGAKTPEAFETLKQMQLLPEKLTYEQYVIWRTDGQTTLFESLATDTQTTANTVKNYLENNLDHLEIRETIDHLITTYPSSDLLGGLQQDLASLGQQIATTNRELAALKKQSLPESAQKITELEQAKTTAENTRKSLLRARKIFRLVNIKPDEVASGYFLEGKDSKQLGDSITKVLEDLKGASAQENSFVYEEVRNMLDALKTSSDEKQNLVSTDSSDPKVWMEVGEKPVASCQNYDQGSHNECLVGYTDPNTKILVLRNQRGKIIARSIFRLLETSTGDPALHIERIYSSSTSKGVLRGMFARAFQKAQEMGLPVLISKLSQTEEGTEEAAQIAEGFGLKDVDYSLLSNASRAPKVYVDSAGGVSYNGLFEMEDLAEIYKAA